MNGVNEKDHRSVDRMYSMMEEDNPDLKPQEILADALQARPLYRWFMDLVHIDHLASASRQIFQVLLMLHLQCLRKHNGDVIRKHLNALYSAGQVHIKRESESKIKLALRSNLRRCSKNVRQRVWICYR